MRAIANKWNLLRIVRLLLGIGVIIKGATDGQVIFALAGGLIALMAVANIGCCGNEGCAVPKLSVNGSSTKGKNIIYEEVGATK